MIQNYLTLVDALDASFEDSALATLAGAVAWGIVNAKEEEPHQRIALVAFLEDGILAVDLATKEHWVLPLHDDWERAASTFPPNVQGALHAFFIQLYKDMKDD